MDEKQLRAVIVEDEAGSRRSLELMLDRFCPEISLEGFGEDVASGLEVIERTKPDLVFLDIEMPDGTGFDLLKRLEEVPFQIIFTTAYDQYAIQAIKFSALDYLLKPISIEELKGAIDRIPQGKLPKKNDSIERLLGLFEQKGDQSQKIPISSQDSVEFVSIGEIIYCEAEGSYTYLFLHNNRKILSTRNLGDYEGLLESFDFFRIHHKHLINLQQVKRFLKEDGGIVEMENGDQLGISRRRKKEFLDRMML